ncbi:MAG: lysophospholipid acyltransferase family protein [Acidimicrobiia bacterium]
MNNPISRRMVTVSLVFAAAAVVSVLLPILLLAALVVDAVMAVILRRPGAATRVVAFTWIYLVGEVWAVLALGLVSLLGKRRSMALTYRLQGWWAAWNYRAFALVFDVSFHTEGSDSAVPPPVIVLARHASLIDSLLPVVFIAQRQQINLRYVLKRELLVDPALDIAGNRLPNYFIDRASSDSESELTSLRELASGMSDSEGVVIFPEGTRFSETKHARLVARQRNKQGTVAELTRAFKNVMPPRPAGTLAILDATDADVVVLAHRGLEGFSGLGDVWAGAVVGANVAVKMWRVERGLVPQGRSERTEWLYRLWAEVDDWVTAGARVDG